MGFILSAAILMLSLWIVARHEAEFNFLVALGISAGVSILGAILGLVIGIFALPVILIALIWALQRFCYITLVQAIIVSGIWIAAQIGLQLALGSLTAN